jgi:cobaltochelatase CobT
LHAGLAPSEGRARAVFDVLEGARCEALGVLRMPGILPNLAAAMAGRLDDLGLLRAHLAAQVPLVEALPMVALDALLDHAEPLLDSGAMEMWHRFARARFGRALAALRPHLDDQAAYAAATGPVLDAIFDAMRWDRADPAAAPERRAAAAARLPVGTEIAPGEDAGGEEDAGRGEAPGGGADAAAGYHRFSTAFDRIVPASALATPEELAALRRRLDASVAVTRAAAARLAHRLQRQLQAERLSAWSFDQEEGMLDTSRLDRVVTDPGAALSFKRERVAAERDTVVTLLIDNSGSMRGRPIALAAMGADLAARALERCGIALEVLGFTTAGWKGGETARRWAEAGRPPHPGRICDLLHIVYKSADQPYRQAREPMALMLRDGLLRENVDGEALLWAAGRLRARPERRRLLLVVSDGAPSDRATLDANDPRYLERHLREVARLLPARRIEVSAIGIGHPVDRVFPDAVVVAGPEGLAPALLSQLGRRLRR